MQPFSWIRLLRRARSLRPLCANKNRPNSIRLVIDQLEDRLQPSATVPSIDGTGNNLAHPNWGSDGSDFLRVGPAAYADGISTPAPLGNPLPQPGKGR